MSVSNFINQAVLGKGIVQEGFLEELAENPLIKLVMFIGTVAFAGYFIIMFGKESWSVAFPEKVVTYPSTETFKTP